MADLIHWLPSHELEVQDTMSALDFNEVCDWGINMAGVPEAWQKTRGAGVTIAVLDTGVAEHDDLRANMLHPHNCSSESTATDMQGHGCILHSDMIYTSYLGLSTIENFYDTVEPSSIVIQPDGSTVKWIESMDVKTLGFTKDHQAITTRVQAVHKLPFKGKLIKVQTRCGQISLTPWHPMYVQTSRRGDSRTIVKKRADELEVGDVLVTPNPDRVFDEYVKVPYSANFVCVYCGYVASKGQRKQCKKCNKYHWHRGETREEMVLDERLAYWLGLIASDGHVMRSSKSIEFTSADAPLAKEFIRINMELFGLNSYEYTVKRSLNTRRCRVHSSNLHAFVQRLGIPEGHKSLSLLFPPLVMRSPRSVIAAFLAGVIDGDGHIDSKSKRIRIASGSREFAYQTSLLLKTIGIRSFVINVKVKDGYAPHYQIRVGNNHEILSYLRLKKPDMASVPAERPRRQAAITDIEIVDHQGFMYDLTVANTHNYVANGFVTSNTHVAGIIAAAANGFGVVGVAPEAKILPIKVLDNNGRSSYDQIARGLRTAIDQRVDIINMSLGSPSAPPQVIHRLIQEAVQQKIIVVAAAGNDGGGVNYPAHYDEVIAVGAVDKNGNLANFSSRGSEIDAVAPGVEIYSTHLHNNYATLRGTSQASPFIAGICALLLAWSRDPQSGVKPIEGYQEMLQRLDDICYVGSEKDARIGRFGDFGYGMPHVGNIQVPKTE